MKKMARPANEEMIAGYFDGRIAHNPEPSDNRSRSYRHGFIAGRSDLERKPRYSFDEMQRMADEAMDADAA